MGEVARLRSGAIEQFDPRKTKARIVGLKEAIKRANRIRNLERSNADVWDSIDDAVDDICTEIIRFCAWWTVTVSPGKGWAGHTQVAGRQPEFIKPEDATHETGIRKDQVSRWKGRLGWGEGGPTREAKFREELRDRAHKAFLAAIKEAVDPIIGALSDNGPFDVVVIDPPWPMSKIQRDLAPNQVDFDYPVMTEEEIKEDWIVNIASRLKDDCHVFVWTTQKFLPMAQRLIEAWGLKYVLTMTWMKPGGFQPYNLPQFNTEFAVYARKGAPKFVDTKDFFCGFSAPRREHSRKPDEFYDIIRRVTGGARLDAYSRESRDGFAQYGNEIGKFNAY